MHHKIETGRFLYGNGCTKYSNCLKCQEKGGCKAHWRFGLFIHSEHFRIYQQTGVKMWEKGKKNGILEQSQ